MARYRHNLGTLAQDRADYAEAARQYQRALDIDERLGDQAGMAAGYHQLGVLAQAQGDYAEAARQYQRPSTSASGSATRLAWPPATTSSACSPRRKGITRRQRRQYQRSLDISERLGDQAGMAACYHQLGILETDRGGQPAIVIAWHVRALAIRLALHSPQVVIDLRHLGEYRRELGTGQFTSLLDNHRRGLRPGRRDHITA